MKYVSILGFSALCAIGLSSNASAQSRAHPECRSFKNSHSCTCAVENGGRVYDDPHRPGRKRWVSARRGTPAHMAFMNCTNRSGAR
ncbi:hypothetical protein [Bosea caraganae]|uniref:hypothetical protein n=1 Tax=Bosea caraganae TaxID=2763117 RepID=UPI0011C02E12|nr:hypothetical protein [Bosea caraganae]